MLLFMYPSAVTTSKLRTAASAQLRQGSGVQLLDLSLLPSGSTERSGMRRVHAQARLASEDCLPFKQSAE